MDSMGDNLMEANLIEDSIAVVNTIGDKIIL